MEIVTVTLNVNPEGSRSDFRDARLSFWDNYARASGSRSNDNYNIEEFASSSEQRVRNQLPQALHRLLIRALVFDEKDEFYRVTKASAARILPSRLILTVREIRYGSMSVDLGLPDLGAFAELVGNNAETFEALFAAYVPDAFDRVLSGNTNSVVYKVSVPTTLQYSLEKSSKSTTPSESEPLAREKGAAILGHLVRSPLIFPVILICFLWYYARQDALEERRLSNEMVQTLITQQTAVIGLLKDKSKESCGNANVPTDLDAHPASANKDQGKNVTNSGKKKE